MELTEIAFGLKLAKILSAYCLKHVVSLDVVEIELAKTSLVNLKPQL
jgi:hypothetical protein